MPSSYTLGAHFEQFIQAQLASGRYNNASEVIRDSLRLMEARDRYQRGSAWAAIERGLKQARAGELTPMEQVFDQLDARLAKMIDDKESRA